MSLTPLLLPADDPGPVQTPPPCWRRGVWSARWLLGPTGAVAPFVAAHRLRLDLAAPLRVRLHVGLAERGFLFIDGRCSAPMPERGSPQTWRLASLDPEADAGPHPGRPGAGRIRWDPSLFFAFPVVSQLLRSG